MLRTTGRPARSSLPYCCRVLRSLRVAKGVTQSGWAAQLAVSRTTVQRWERREVAPDPAMERVLPAHCAARGPLRTYDSGPLAGQPVSASWLVQLVAEARMGSTAPPFERRGEDGGAASGGSAPTSETAAIAPARLAAPHTGWGAPFVGRAAELGVMRAAQSAAREGQGRLLLVGGEPGIGKTALCEVVAAEAVAAGAQVRWGRGWEGGGAPALWPWMQIIAAHAAMRPAETLRDELGAGAPDIVQLVPEVHAALPDVPSPAPIDPEAAQHYERCLTLIFELGEESGADEAEMILALGRCQRNGANLRAEWLAAWQRLTRAIAAFRERGDGGGVARATIEALAVDMSPARRIALVDAALAELGDAPVLEARLLAAGIADDEITDETDGLAQRASELAERYDILDVKAMIARREGTRAERRGRLDETIAGYRRAYRHFHAAGQTAYAGRVPNWAVMARMDDGDLQTGEQEAEEALTYLRSVGSSAGEDSMLVALAGNRLARRELDAFEETLRPIARDNYWPPILRARLAEQQGDLDKAARLLPELETAFGIPFSLAMMHGARARIFWRMGRLDDARRELAGFCTTMFSEGRTLVNQTRVFAYAEIEAALAALSFDQMWGTFALRLGLLCEAEQHYRKGLEWSEREGCFVEAGRCLLGLAEIAAGRGDRDEAHVQLDLAAPLFEHYGAPLYRREVEAVRGAMPV